MAQGGAQKVQIWESSLTISGAKRSLRIESLREQGTRNRRNAQVERGTPAVLEAAVAVAQPEESPAALMQRGPSIKGKYARGSDANMQRQMWLVACVAHGRGRAFLCICFLSQIFPGGGIGGFIFPGGGIGGLDFDDACNS